MSHSISANVIVVCLLAAKHKHLELQFYLKQLQNQLMTLQKTPISYVSSRVKLNILIPPTKQKV